MHNEPLIVISPDFRGPNTSWEEFERENARIKLAIAAKKEQEMLDRPGAIDKFLAAQEYICRVWESFKQRTKK